jgi:hypothetical protein
MADYYYGYYDAQMSDGKVFDTDLNLQENVQRNRLTAKEIEERTVWCGKIDGIKDHYRTIRRTSSVSSLELMLQERVMVPNLACRAVSTRSRFKEPRDGRRYPETMSCWANFAQSVEGWTAPNVALDDYYFDIFKISMLATSVKTALSDEEAEKVCKTRSSLFSDSQFQFISLTTFSLIGVLAIDLESILGGGRCIWRDCESVRDWEA